jgi:crotonobetainyl-CoA:carnitine CoA-transferase CaiB-like acyl-CoA transferase
MERTFDSTNKPGPLSGVRVVEYGVFHAGPGASAILGDLGADVIKIEAGMGDPERFWASVGGISIALKNGQSIMYEVSNRNKRGVWIDIESARGRGVFEDLVKTADVFLTNLRKSTKIKKGLDYESIRRINPKIIHANVSGYGPEGPLADMGAFDPMGQARSGMMYLHDPQNPQLIHLAILDQATAICASHAILAALFVRERHGYGQEVHASLYGAGLWLMVSNFMCLSLLGRDPGMKWVRNENSPLRNSFVCKDGKWIIGVHHPDEKYWEAFVNALSRPELLSDPRFIDGKSRHAHCQELLEICDAVLAQKTRDEWMEIFPAHGLMFSPVQRMKDVLTDPQAIENGYVVEFDHPEHGRIKVPGYPAHFSAGQAGMRLGAPYQIGRDTDEVLLELGYTKDAVQGMREAGVVK